MVGAFCLPVLGVLFLAACSGQPGRPTDARPEVAAVVDAGPVPTAGGAGCQADVDCARGSVCVHCSQGPGECVAGCSSSADCPAGSSCAQVQCIRCPCPAQCIQR